MRVLMIVKANAETEAGVMPTTEQVEAMGVYNNELIAAGVLVDGAGLHPSSKGARLSYRGGKPVITDGPFTETKELIAGYWVLNVKDWDEALMWLSKVPRPDFKDGDVEDMIELRRFFEPEDFAGIASQEMIDQEIGWREEQLGKAPKG
ncbi:YciI family protein [Caulobacter sp. SLTY]|uniref:YciI family protein n=1 Tax=Caulobacter sp. SLTY TaxID=2683262 RepID=UPI00141332BD|nr:YciI family protein [Caulobacter sp. SLTY]NBB14064.1 YciI family protein [Caulobacter sp. SLTY]